MVFNCFLEVSKSEFKNTPIILSQQICKGSIGKLFVTPPSHNNKSLKTIGEKTPGTEEEAIMGFIRGPLLKKWVLPSIKSVVAINMGIFKLSKLSSFKCVFKSFSILEPSIKPGFLNV